MVMKKYTIFGSILFAAAILLHVSLAFSQEIPLEESEASLSEMSPGYYECTCYYLDDGVFVDGVTKTFATDVSLDQCRSDGEVGLWLCHSLTK